MSGCRSREHYDRVCFEAIDFGQLLPSNVELEFSIQFKSVVAWIFLTEPWSIIDEQHGVLWSLFSFGASASNYSLKVFRIFSA